MRVLVGVGVALWLVGCAEAQRERVASGDSVSVRAPSVEAIPAGWVTTSWQGSGGDPVRDAGVGVVPLRLPHDTVVLRASPEPGAAAVAAALVVSDSGGGWRYEVRAAEGLAPALFEYGYEEAGLPIDEERPSGWLRVLAGWRADGSPVAGWLQADSAIVWRRFLVGWPAFVTDSAAPDFRAIPDGAALPFPAGAHTLYIDSIAGDWARVRVVTPPDLCDERAADAVEATGWLRLFDGRGRPRVWYHTRGC